MPNLTHRSQQSSAFNYSVSKVRHSRVKIENDVLKMHNRINMLKLEEDRALKIIEDARHKAE